MGVQESFFFGPNQDLAPSLPFPKDFFWNLQKQGLHFGTSSWKFRGWEGILYSRGYASEADFQRASLREYADTLSTVSVDFTFYDFPQVSQISSMHDSVPNNFHFCYKVTDKIVMEKFPNLAKYGRLAGQHNPFFLDPHLFLEHFWRPLERFQNQIGLLNFEFPELQPRNMEQLDRFFNALPKEIPCALELRSPGLFQADFYRALLDWGVSPCFNAWTGMPAISCQAELWREVENHSLDRSKLSPLFIRAMVPARYTHEESMLQFEPFDQLRRVNDDLIASIANVVERAKAEGRQAYVILGNLLEGSAPLSLGRLAKHLR